MPVLETSHDQARRQQLLTGLVVGGLILTAVAIAIALWISASHSTKVTQIPLSPAPDVNYQQSGYTFTQSDKGRTVFKIHAARTISYQGGNSTMLEDVRVETYGRKGDTGDVLRTDRCQYNPTTGDFLAAGPVQIELSANSPQAPDSGLRGKHPVDVETSKVAYQQKEQVADTDAPVKFRMGNTSGTAVGMTYEVGSGGLELKHEVAAEIPQGTEAAPGKPIHLTASSLQYDKEGGSITLSGPVEVTQAGDRGLADHALIILGADRRVRRIVLHGNAKAFENNALKAVEIDADEVEGSFDGASGNLRHILAQGSVKGETKSRESSTRFAANRAEFDLTGKQPKPTQGVATGNVRLEGESHPVVGLNPQQDSKSQERRTLDASEVHMVFRPDTHGLKTADTAGPGTLTISPNSPQVGLKVIHAGHLVMNFDARSRIETLEGTQSSKVLLYPAPSSATQGGPAQSTADRLQASFDPQTSNLREMHQTGNFVYLDGDRKATADEAQYDPVKQTLALVGHPQVLDPRSRITSQNMNINLQTNTAIGEVNVKGYHQQDPAANVGGATNPSLPTNVLADKVVANKTSQTIHYEGHVRAWNGSDVIQSPALDVYRAQRRVSTSARVVTSFMQSFQGTAGPEGSAHPAAEPRPVTVQSDALEYFDEGRRARYLGHVRMVSDSMIMQSDKLDVYLTATGATSGSQVDHAIADGKVKVTEPERVGTGNHGEYFAAAGKIILTGGPPVLVDEKKGNTTGQRLTFFIHDDRLLVDGGAQSPSVTQHRVAP